MKKNEDYKIGDYVEILSNGAKGSIMNINYENANPYWIESENGVKAWYNSNGFI